jgi:hypothetical protein
VPHTAARQVLTPTGRCQPAAVVALALSLALVLGATLTTTTAGAAPVAHPAEVAYGPLSRVDASASGASVQGRNLTVRITLHKKAGVRLAVVSGQTIRGYAKRQLSPGKYLFKGRLSATPRGSHLQLRITVRLVGGRRGRQRYPLTIVVPTPGVPTIVPANHAPTNISLSGSSVSENLPAGTTIGTFSATDLDTADPEDYTLVPGAGSADNASFTISGSSLKTAASFDYETKASYAIRVRVSDEHGGTFEKAFTIAVTKVNQTPVATVDVPPTVKAGGSLAYTENDPATAIDPALTVTDPDSATLTGAVVAIVDNHRTGQDKLALPAQPTITASYDDAGGVLILSGSATVAAYQAALRAVTYANSSDNPDAATRTISFAARDASSLGLADTSTVSVTPVNDPPALATSAGALSYVEGDSPTAVDPDLVLTDPDSQIQGATVRISSNFASAEDSLGLPAQPVVTGAYDAATGTLTLSGAADVTAYQAALRAVTYSDGSQNPSTATRTLSFQATDTAPAASNIATRTVDVTGTDTPPTVIDAAGSLAYTENDPSAPIDPAVAVTDPDSANLTGATVALTGNHAAGEDVLALPTQPVITATFEAATGRLTLTGTDTVAEYQAALRAVTYANTSDDPSTLARTATFTARDAGGFGTPGTHGISITAVDDPPVAVADTATVVEDSGANAIDVLANDTDIDGGPQSVQGVTQPANGTVAITGGGTGLTYAPSSNYCNSPPGPTSDSFAYALNGGSTATVSVTVTCVDDPPVAVDDSSTVVEDSGTNAIDVVANDTDIDGGPKSVESVSQPADGTVAITGGGSGLTYAPGANYCNDPPGSTPDTFTYTLNGGSTATVSVTVTCVDDPPVAVGDSATTTEDPTSPVAIHVLDNDTDIDGGPKSVASFTQPPSGVVIDGGSGVLLYAPVVNYCNTQPGGSPDTFTYALNGGSTATVSVTVTCVPDPPTVTSTASSLTYTENDPPTPIDPGLGVSDPDFGAMVSGATVRITTNYAGSEDGIALGGSHPSITASLTGDTLTLSGTDTDAAYQAALRDVTYSDSSDAPSSSTRTITFTVTDETALSGSASRDVAVVPVDDPPVAVDDAATVLEQASATAITVLANDTDVDGGPKSIQSVTQPAKGTVAITGGGSGLTYKPDANYCNDPPGTSPDTFSYALNGSSTATVSLTVTCVNQAPVAADDSISGTSSAVGNTTLVVNSPADGPPAVSGPSKTVDYDILANDADPDGPNPLAVSPGTFATNDGGSVTIQADGDFVYTPAAGTSCTDHSDFFDYTVTDGNPVTPGTDVGRVTIAITGCVWYVDNTATGGSGTSTAPFGTLGQAQSASSPGDTIYVEHGDGTSSGYAAGIALKSGQSLVGAAAPLQVGADVLATGDQAQRPLITNSGADVVTLAAGDTVTGVQIDPSGAGGISGTGATVVGGTLADVKVIDTGTPGTQPGLELSNTTGTFDISDLTVDLTGASTNATGVLLSSAGTVNFAAGGTVSIKTALGRALDATSTNLGAGSVFDDITVTGGSAGGVSMVNTTGTTSLGDGSGADLSLTTSSGATAAFLLNNAGAVTVPAAGTSNISATGGPAISVSGTSGPSLSFDSVSSTSSSGGGVVLSGLGTGTFSATGGAIAGAAGTAVSVTGGSGAISYGGAINDGTGASALVTGRTGGTVTLSGNIADGGDAGGGIAVTGNSGGSTVLSGASKTLSTGASPAITMTSDTGHTVSISGGGLAITTTSATGLGADSGTLAVSGPGNSIATTTGGALLLDDATIGASNATFQSVSSNGAGNAIRLDNTGSSGRLVVTGNGGTCTPADASGCSGGLIQNASGSDDSSATPVGAGIVLDNTLNPSFTRMQLHDFSNYAIRGTSVSGFTLDSSVVDGANGTNDATPYADSSLLFTDLTGSATISNSAISGGYADNVSVINDAGSLDRITFAADTIGDNNPANGNDAVALESLSSAGALKATITNSTFTGARGDLVDYDHEGNGAGDLNINASHFSNNHNGIATGGGGLTLTNSGTSGPTTMEISGNTFRDAVGPGVLVVKLTGSSTQTGTFAGNTIGVSGVQNSGSLAGSGLKLQTVGQGTMTWSVTGNQIYGYNNNGVEVEAGGGASAQSGTLNTTITGNTIDQPGTAAGSLTLPKNGIQFNVGTVPGDTYQACAVLGGVGGLANVLGSSGADGVPSVGGGQDVRLRQRQSTTFRLPGYAGAATDTTAVATFVEANNPSGGASAIASVSSPPGGGYTGTGTSCP